VFFIFCSFLKRNLNVRKTFFLKKGFLFVMAEIRGKFIDTESGEGIINSRIELRGLDNGLIAVTATNEEGIFEFKDVQPGDYNVIGKSPIHMPAKFSLTGRYKVVEPGVGVELRTVKVIL